MYRFQSRIADRMQIGRVLLAGDAAHLFAPFGARGLNSGVCDVENAAWKIAFVRRGWAGEALLDSYCAERLPAAAENLAVTVCDDALPRPRHGRRAAASRRRARARRDRSRRAPPRRQRPAVRAVLVRRLADRRRQIPAARSPAVRTAATCRCPAPGHPRARLPGRRPGRPRSSGCGSWPVAAASPCCSATRPRCRRHPAGSRGARGGAPDARARSGAAGDPRRASGRAVAAAPGRARCRRRDERGGAARGDPARRRRRRWSWSAPRSSATGMVLAAHRPGSRLGVPRWQGRTGRGAGAPRWCGNAARSWTCGSWRSGALGTAVDDGIELQLWLATLAGEGAEGEHRPRRVALAGRGRSRQRRLAAGRRAVARVSSGRGYSRMMEIVVRGHRPPGRRFDTYTNVHVGLQVRSQPSGLVPGRHAGRAVDRRGAGRAVRRRRRLPRPGGPRPGR